MFWKLLLVVLVIVAAVVALAAFRKFLRMREDGKYGGCDRPDCPKKMMHGGNDNFARELNEKLKTTFYEPVMIVDIEKINSALPVTLADVTKDKSLRRLLSKPNTITNALNKIVAEAITHLFVFRKVPNDISQKTLGALAKSLGVAIDAIESKFAGIDIGYELSRLKDFKQRIESETTGKTALKSYSDVDLDTCLRKFLVNEATEGASKRAEIERLERELKECRDKKQTVVALPGISSLSTSLSLDQCLREREALQRKIDELYRELDGCRERLRGVGVGADVSMLRSQIDNLNAQRMALENNLRLTQQQYEGEISKYKNEFELYKREFARFRDLENRLAHCENDLAQARAYINSLIPDNRT